jgi:peptide/nickel transport system substrate-binding protein
MNLVQRVVTLFRLGLGLGLVFALVGCPDVKRTYEHPAVDVNEPPQYGGDLNIGTVYVSLSPLSWDPADWSWKLNHDTGAVREQLFAADLKQAERYGGAHNFRAEAYIPAEALRGELAESWYWEDELTLVVNLRRDVIWPEKEGMMSSRPLTAEDVVFTYHYVDQSPKRIATYFEHIDRVEARDSHTLVFHLSKYNAEWAYRFGYGYYTGVVPVETVNIDAKDWRNVTGTGPFSLERYIQSNAQIYARNPDYWDTEEIGGREYEIPFVDSVSYRIIKDEATRLSALRTGKLDVLEVLRWIAVDHLKETTPELKWKRSLNMAGTFMVLRMDEPPFDDVRVRRAINLAVNQKEIMEQFYGGHAELMAYPQHPDFGAYYEPLETMPDSVQELFTFNPEKARKLLADAGVPAGFEFDVQLCSCSVQHMDLAPLLARYLENVGLTVNLRPLEYASFLSMMTTRNHSAGYLMSSGHTNPTTALRKNFLSGQLWNPAQFSDADIDERLELMLTSRDETDRVEIARKITREVLDEAPYLWLPTPYVYTAWWPWVKNYDGETRAGAVRPGPIYARMWIDEELKRSMGFE